MDLEQIKNSIIKKIDSHSFKFNDDDIILLEVDDELRYRLYDILKNNPSLFTVELVDIVERFPDYQTVFVESIDLLIAYAKALIASGNYDPVIGIGDYADGEKAEEILEYFFKTIDSFTDEDRIYNIGSEIIELALDHKKFDFLHRIKSCRKLDESTIVKLIEYAQAVDIVPDFYAHNYVNIKLDYSKYSATALLVIFNEAMENNVASLSSDDIQKIYNLILQRLRNKEVFDLQEFSNNISLQFLKFDTSFKRELIELLIDVVGLNSTIISSIDAEFDEYEDLFASSINKDTNLADMYYYSISYIESKKILEKLLEYGHLNYAIKFKNFANYIPLIIEKIKSGDPLFKDMKFKYSSDFYRYPALLDVMLQYDMIPPMVFDSFHFRRNNSLVEFVLSEISKGTKMTFNYGCYSIDGIFETIIRSRNFETLKQSDLSQLEIINISDELLNILIEELKSNFSLAYKLLSKASNIIFKNKELFNFYLQTNGYFIEQIIDKINHNESLEYLYNEEIYNFVKVYYAEKYSLNMEHLNIFSSKFGMKIIRYFDNEVIHQLINLPDGEFNKFISLFPSKKMELNDVINIYDSIMQYKFSKEHPDVVNIFADIMHSFEDKDNVYIKKLEELYSILNDKFYDKFKEQYPELVELFKSNPKEFLLQIVHKIQSKTEDIEPYVEILHFITNYYIAYKREQYRETYSIYSDSYLSLPYDLDDKDKEKKLVDYCLRYSPHDTKIMAKLIKQGMSFELANKCRLYFLSKKDKTSSPKEIEVRIFDGKKIEFSLSEVEEIKKNLRILSLISKEYVKNENLQYIVDFLDDSSCIGRIYKLPDNIPDIYQLLINLNVNALKSTLNNQDAYDSLHATMHKYRLHFIPNGFKGLLESEYIEISGDYNNLSGFISYYDKIYESEKSRLASQGNDTKNIVLKPVVIFIYGEVYSSVSSVYSQVLGSKDAKLIKANPPSNEATRKTKGNMRLNEAVEWTVSNFKRMSVTVPAIAQNVILESGKTLYVVVGNFTNPSNVTHGERTGACMRIGGVGETLFQFCLANENGFHIRFENPETGEYISRVSGFRNGNTVFLNELRNSCNFDAYSNEDVVEACRKVAELLVEISKDSNCPIDNVVIHTEYAVDHAKYSKTYLGVSSIKVGLPSFYSDVSSSAYILATSSVEHSFVPLNFDKSQVPTYLPAREKARESANLKDLFDMINRVSGIKSLLAGHTLDSLEPIIIDDNFVYGMASNDWYIYLDTSFEIHEDYIDIDKRAQEELAIARKHIEELIPIIEKKKAYSY